MKSLSIGLSALQANQNLLDLVGQNISNANTAGFHRREAVLTTRVDGGKTGAGVDVKEIRRRYNALVESSRTDAASDLGQVQTEADTLRRLESLFQTGEGSVRQLFDQFFADLRNIGQQPDSETLRRQFLGTAERLGSGIQDSWNQLSNINASIRSETNATVDQVTIISQRIAELNVEIKRAEVNNSDGNGLKDQRDLALGDLANLVGIRIVEQEFGSVNVFSGTLPLVLDGSVLPITTAISDDNKLVVKSGPDGPDLTIENGRLSGLLRMTNELLPAIQDRLTETVQAFLADVNSIHSQGVGLDGAFSTVRSSFPVLTINTPLSAATLSNDVKNAKMYIGITDSAGDRRQYAIDVNPTIDSLTTLAGKISTVPHIQGIVDSQSGELFIQAEQGFRFDFAGGIPTKPQSTGWTGTSQARVEGTYAGAQNDAITYTVIGNGQVGITAGLKLEARNSAGTLLGVQNIGLGYQPDSNLNSIEGVELRMSFGSVIAGETLTIDAVTDADPGRYLSALGINALFTGGTPANIQVSTEIQKYPERLALARTEESGNAANLDRLLRIQTGTGGYYQPPTKAWDQMLGRIGTDLSLAEGRESGLIEVKTQLDIQQQQESGVDENEELVKMIQYQRSFQMAAQYVSVINQTLDELFRITG